ncbi:MAG: terminase small subunit [Pseudomonadota bacterium]
MALQKKLTPKQARFVQEYLIDLNATRSAIRAGYSKKTAQQMGAENLSKPVIAAAIAESRSKLAEKTEITQKRVIEEYAKPAFLDPRKFYDDDGNLIPVHQLPAEVAAALTGMDVSTFVNKDNGTVTTVTKFKFADKKAALDSLAKHLGMFMDRVKHGFDEKSLNLILSALPPDFAEAVRRKLAQLIKT